MMRTLISLLSTAVCAAEEDLTAPRKKLAMPTCGIYSAGHGLNGNDYDSDERF